MWDSYHIIHAFTSIGSFATRAAGAIKESKRF